MKIKVTLFFISVLVIAAILRSWQIGSLPASLNVDEVSEGYNAYSLLKTGKDRYGMSFPIIFKSFGSYQPPVYTYLTTIPVFLLGPNITAVKVVSIVSGLICIIFTFLIIRKYLVTKNDWLSLQASLTVAISPWAIFFSRIATEASPALALFVAGFYFILRSPDKPKYFPLATLLLGLATHAYYSERIISILFLGVFVLIYRKKLWKGRKWILLGLIIFGITQIPHILILKSGAFGRRLEQVTYFGRGVSVVREFLSQFFAYFSPRNLFFIPDDQVARSIPDLSVFYKWMIVPYFFGLAHLIKKHSDYFIKNLIVLMLIAPIPAALTTDPFYTLRVFILLWCFSIVIALGIWQITERIKSKRLSLGLLTILLVGSLFTFYTHYFVLYRFERSNTVGYPDMELIKITRERPNETFVVDLSRDISNGMRFVFFRQYDPVSFQKEIGGKFLEKYYTSVDYEQEYKIDNVEIRPIYWEEDIFKDQIVVGDPLAISETQVTEHKLKLEFEIKDMAGEVALLGYSTNPKEKCLSLKTKDIRCK